jgi:hypothetical protein
MYSCSFILRGGELSWPSRPFRALLFGVTSWGLVRLVWSEEALVDILSTWEEPSFLGHLESVFSLCTELPEHCCDAEDDGE